LGAGGSGFALEVIEFNDHISCESVKIIASPPECDAGLHFGAPEAIGVPNCELHAHNEWLGHFISFEAAQVLV
jgi:hypothetical protein